MILLGRINIVPVGPSLLLVMLVYLFIFFFGNIFLKSGNNLQNLTVEWIFFFFCYLAEERELKSK